MKNLPINEQYQAGVQAGAEEAMSAKLEYGTLGTMCGDNTERHNMANEMCANAVYALAMESDDVLTPVYFAGYAIGYMDEIMSDTLGE